MLYIFAAIGNPISLTWSLIARDMFNVSRTIEGDVTRLARNVPLVVPKKCYYFSELFDIFDFFLKTTSYEVSRLVRNVPLGVLKKCSYILEQFKIQDGHPSF